MGLTLAFQYAENALRLDTVAPVYRAHFAAMRGVQIAEDEMKIRFPLRRPHRGSHPFQPSRRDKGGNDN